MESTKRAEPRCHTICVWGKATFHVFPNANEDNALELHHLARELDGKVTFPRFLTGTASKSGEFLLCETLKVSAPN